MNYPGELASPAELHALAEEIEKRRIRSVL